MKRAVFLVILILIPTGAASPASLAIQAISMRATGGEAIVADLAVLLAMDNARTLPPADFILQAQRVEIQTDTAAIAIGPEGALPTWAHEPQTEVRHFEQAFVKGAWVRPGYRAILLPGPDSKAEVATDCLTSTLPNDETASFLPFVQSPSQRPTMQVDLREAFQVAPCLEQFTVHVSGDFTLVLWEWDATIEAATGHHSLNSGYQSSLPGLVSYGTVREQYLVATDGNLQLTLPTTGTSILMKDADLSGFSRISFDHAAIVGQPEGRYTVQGILTVQVAAKNATLQVLAMGDELRINDSLMLTSTSVTPNRWPLVLMVPLVLLVTGLVFMVRHSDHRAFDYAQRGCLARARLLLLAGTRHTFAAQMAKGMTTTRLRIAIQSFEAAHALAGTREQQVISARYSAMAHQYIGDEPCADAWKRVLELT